MTESRSLYEEALEALKGLLADIEGLMDESQGVYGLHLNGDPSPWSELDEGGRFERLTHLSAVRSTIAKLEAALPLQPVALPFDPEYAHGYLEEVLTDATGNADPEMRKLLGWLKEKGTPHA